MKLVKDVLTNVLPKFPPFLLSSSSCRNLKNPQDTHGHQSELQGQTTEIRLRCSLLAPSHFRLTYFTCVGKREREEKERVCCQEDRLLRPAVFSTGSVEGCRCAFEVLSPWVCNQGCYCVAGLGDWLQAFHVPSFPVHPYVSTLFPQENAAVSLLSLHLRCVRVHKKADSHL